MILRITKKIRVNGAAHLDELSSLKNVLLVANHPSMVDPFLITPAAFWPKMLFNPFRYFPWQTPDSKNYLWLFPWFRFGRFVCVKRSSNGERNDPIL